MLAEIVAREAEIAALCRRCAVLRLDLFGSALRESFNPEGSDLDFLVEFLPLPPARYACAFFELKEGLETLFATPVDLVTAASLKNPYFLQRLTETRQGLYAA